MSKSINRRKFITNSALTTAGLMFGSQFGAFASSKGEKFSASSEETAAARFDLMKEVKKYRKLDAHVHPNLGTVDPKIQAKHTAELIDYADRLGVDKLFLSKPVTTRENSPEAFRASNNVIINAMKQHPNRIAGMFTFDPRWAKESQEEINRCIGEGMFGTKLYFHNKINDPLNYPFIEQLIDKKMVIFSHAELQLGVGGYRMKYNGNKAPNTSIPEDFVDIAKRYPEGVFQFAHIGGGGDWEYMCKALKHSPNVYVDTSGSNNEEWIIDFAVKELGEDRLFFGSDNCYYQSVGKILASNLNEAQKKKIFFDNYNNILRKAGKHVN